MLRFSCLTTFAFGSIFLILKRAALVSILEFKATFSVTSLPETAVLSRVKLYSELAFSFCTFSTFQLLSSK